MLVLCAACLSCFFDERDLVCAGVLDSGSCSPSRMLQLTSCAHGACAVLRLVWRAQKGKQATDAKAKASAADEGPLRSLCCLFFQRRAWFGVTSAATLISPLRVL